MAVNQSDTDTNLFTGVDLRAFWETLRLRWWIIPAVLAVSVGFLWAQASELRTEPDLYSVTRTYEARDPTAVLASVGIDPVSVRAFPDAANQLLILQSDDVRKEISVLTGTDVGVSVSRGQPTFSLVDTLESDGQSSFVFQSAGVPTYTFSCINPDRIACEVALDAYVERASTLRRGAFVDGLTDLRAVLTTVTADAPNAEIAAKIHGLDALLERIQTPFVQISERVNEITPTISTVRTPTYTFGMGAGLLISLLILLQLTYSDRRVRSARQLANEVGASTFLGSICTQSNSSNDILAAVSLQRACLRSKAGTIRFIPLTEAPPSEPLERLSAMCKVPSHMTKPFSQLSVPEITGDETTDDIAVLVAQRNQDLRQHLLTAVSALRRSGRQFAGVLLLD